MGWREITARDASGGEVVATDVPRYERSRGLEAYPADPSESPPQQRQAELDIRIVSVADASQPAPAEHPAGPTSVSTPRDRFTALIGVKRLSLGVILPALAIAFGLGCFHALSPGHGKTVVAAYLVGSRGTPRHAVLLGLVVTATHVAGVFALGLAVLVASAYVLPERLYPWLGFVSGLMILMLGVWQFTRRYAVRYVRARGMTEAVLDEDGQDVHTHEVPDRITPSALIALGVSGGIVPCPSALIVMLGAVALGRTAFGLVLVVAFSIGLAAILVLIGLLMLYARRLVERLSWAPAALGTMPLISPVLVAAIGAVIAARSVLAGGLLIIK
jgi:ABC-type nickel/cobalt efflux system permease component RcnA